MEFKFNFPLIDEGYYKLVDFPYWFKHPNGEIYTKIKFTHFIHKLEDRYYVEKPQDNYDAEMNIKYLMFLKLGDKFSYESKRLKIKNKQLRISIDCTNNNKFIKPKKNSLPFSESGYYEFDFKNSDSLKIIIPAVVIAQAFFFVNSFIIENMFRESFNEVEKLINWETKMEGILKIGQVSLKKYSDDSVKSMAKSFAFFLFSKDDCLYKRLVQMQAHLYKKFFNTPFRNEYIFLIPIKEKLKLTINGSYQNHNGKTYFIANEIVKVDSIENFENLYDVDDIRFIDYIYSSESSENKSFGNKSRSKRKRKNHKITATDEDVNNNLMETFLESGRDILADIAKLSIEIKKKKKSQAGLPIDLDESPYGTFDRNFSNPDSRSGGIVGGKENPHDSEFLKKQAFSMIYNVVNKLKSEFIISEYKTNNSKIVIFDVSDEFHHKSILISDCYNKRIQIIRKVTLEKFEKGILNNFIKLIDDCDYNWSKVKNSKSSDGILIEQPTNYNIDGTRIVKKSLNDDGTVINEKISDLCYLNVLKKLRNLYVIE